MLITTTSVNIIRLASLKNGIKICYRKLGLPKFNVPQYIRQRFAPQSVMLFELESKLIFGPPLRCSDFNLQKILLTILSSNGYYQTKLTTVMVRYTMRQPSPVKN